MAVMTFHIYGNVIPTDLNSRIFFRGVGRLRPPTRWLFTIMKTIIITININHIYINSILTTMVGIPPTSTRDPSRKIEWNRGFGIEDSAAERAGWQSRQGPQCNHGTFGRGETSLISGWSYKKNQKENPTPVGWWLDWLDQGVVVTRIWGIITIHERRIPFSTRIL